MSATEQTAVTDKLKDAVQQFWQRASCGEEAYARGETLRQQLEQQARARYELEPYIFDFARFSEGRDKDVLEVGVGMGADHLEWARSSPRSLTGVDLTARAVEFTRTRLVAYGFNASVRTADAERLPFDDKSFDLVYSWGVLHHTPDTPRAVSEVLRVLRSGGRARVMIYHTPSLVGDMLWLRYGLLRGKPTLPMREMYGEHLESPGTKAYTVAEARQLFSRFSKVDARSQLSFGDLLQGGVGQRHRGQLLSLAKALWPRSIIRRLLPGRGLMLLVDAVK